ncbi:MAG: ammonium transporter [Gammaproteobacteria bacterium]
MTHFFKRSAVAGLLAVLLPVQALAADELSGADTAWIITATALVLFMTLPGLALFYGGLVRTKNVLSVLMQCFVIAAAASIVWFLVGYSLAFSGEGDYIGDLSKALLAGVGPDSLSGTIPETVFIMFQGTFAIITPALIVGGFAERMKFSAMLIFAMIWLLVVYIPTTHWVWGGGWLGDMGLYDFAGGTVVHINAGVAALVAAIVLGNRKGFGTQPMPPHNLTMTVTGASMLWVGWFGFNAGSALGANGGAGMAMLVTHLGASAGVLAWMAMEWIRHGKPSVLGAVTGMVAGLGTITPASGFVGPGGAVIIGLLAGVVCYFATDTLKRKLKIDDSLDVMPVHGVGGIIGTLFAGIFAAPALGGFGFADGIETMGGQVGVQLIGIVATLVYCAIATWIILKVVGLLTGGLRVDQEQETEGLDIVSHDEVGYNL